MRKGSYTLLYIGILTVFLLTACQQKTVYHRYLHTTLSGWERNDTLFFAIPPIKQEGEYIEEVEVRINGSYPFMSLCLIIEETNTDIDGQSCDTLLCNLIDRRGHPQGDGISQFQNTFRLKTVRLHKDDSLRIAIRHDMKREILPGITDIGVKLRKK